MRFVVGDNGQKKAGLLLQLFAVSAYFIHAQALIICEVGREKDETNTWMWVLPYPDPCLCTEVIMGGINTWTAIRPFKPTYVFSPLISNDVEKIREHYNVTCKEEDESTTAVKRSATPTEIIDTTQVEPETASGEVTSEAIAKQETTPGAVMSEAVTAQECKPGPLGMASGDISDSSINASSYQHPPNQWPRKPEFTRLGFNFSEENVGGTFYPSVRYWGSEESDKNPWIQVDLGSNHTVTGLQTEGNKGKHPWQYWVEQVKVQVGTTPEDLYFVDDGNGAPEVFDANENANSIADITLDVTGILTRFVRIYPINCKKTAGTSSTCFMRFEVLGCLEK